MLNYQIVRQHQHHQQHHHCHWNQNQHFPIVLVKIKIHSILFKLNINTLWGKLSAKFRLMQDMSIGHSTSKRQEQGIKIKKLALKKLIFSKNFVELIIKCSQSHAPKPTYHAPIEKANMSSLNHWWCNFYIENTLLLNVLPIFLQNYVELIMKSSQ